MRGRRGRRGREEREREREKERERKREREIITINVAIEQGKGDLFHVHASLSSVIVMAGHDFHREAVLHGIEMK